MKTLLIPLLMITGINLAHADEAISTGSPSAEQGRAVWQSMTSEQQAEARATAKTAAQEQRVAWGALSPEEKSIKQAAAREKLQPYRDTMQAKMQERLSSRPFGRR